MALKDSMQIMIKNLSEQTINGRLSWVPVSDTKMEVDIDDIKFEFFVTWKLELSIGWVMCNGWINLKSKDLNFILYSHNHPEEIKAMRDYLANIYFNKYKPSDQDAVDRIDDISKKISLENYRDNKIKNILDNNGLCK